ncbi:hypothetical protein [Streptomyces spirodelae]|uniref:Uncharacterized protein n=1 Tax=Streptomyces spirodelae TaxID=2812904 RepID=A0ABS3WN55_9ACTN|nr:hypothetical protein [Streptomyces spirodelae]MBO8184546.1 hypothetical protein [Streptomyces spirodelae]
MTASVARVMNESFTVAADGSYAARLTTRPGTELWYPERWTLDGPEPYAVPLPVEQPEEADSQVLPLKDGRVLIARPAPGRHSLALLYPSGPETGERRLGTVETDELRLLPPAPCGMRTYALAREPGGRTTGVWLVTDGSSRPPARVALLRGRCSGGAWLDREGRLLALDTAGPDGEGPTKTVAVDLGTGGEVSPLLEITEDSDDRLLLADPDSGLLLVRSNAPGTERLGWGVLGSHRPVRFPEALHPQGARLTPIAVQPGQTLLPERCAVALRVDTPTGVPPRLPGPGGGTWLAVWRPGLRELRHLASPPGWLTGHGLWTADGELRVPYSTAHTPCGLARMRTPLPDEEKTAPASAPAAAAPAAVGPVPAPEPMPAPGPAPGPAAAHASTPAPAPAPRRRESGDDVTALQHHDHGVPPSGLLGSMVRRRVSAGSARSFGATEEPVPKPVPLQQAPLASGTA